MTGIFFLPQSLKKNNLSPLLFDKEGDSLGIRILYNFLSKFHRAMSKEMDITCRCHCGSVM